MALPSFLSARGAPPPLALARGRRCAALPSGRSLGPQALVFSVTLLVAAAGASAQTAPPTLQTVSPTGAQRGTRATLVLRGTNIHEPKRLIFSEPGFSASITAVRELPIEKPMTPKGVVRTDAPIDDKARRYEVTAAVTIAGDVPHGVHGLRVETPLGISNLLRFAVSALPEVADREPNDGSRPVKVTLPATLVGALGAAGDVDGYQFRAQPGEELVFQVVARPLGSRVDSVLRIHDAAGKLLAENNDFDLGRDSVLVWRASAAGPFTLTMEDVEHGGAAEGFAYRIYAGALPFVTDIFPLGTRVGSQPGFVARGANLGKAPAIHLQDPAPGGSRVVAATVSAAGGSALNRKAVVLGNYTEVGESEPNDELAGAGKLEIPSTVNGRIHSPDTGTPAGKQQSADSDVFRFSARKGQKLVLDVTAQQAGSPLDSVIEILDASGRPVPRATIRCLSQTEIALNDPDSNRRSMRLATWNELAINDIVMVGDELLEVESMPTHPDDDLVFKSYRGVRVTQLDTSTRNHSVGAAVYKVQIHPPGARLEPNGMPIFRLDYVNDDGGSRFGGKDSRLHFDAPADGEYFVRLRDVRGLQGERFAYRLTIREPTPDFALTFDPKSFNLPRGGRVSLTVTADRRDGFDGPIDVELRDLPAGITATSGRIPGGAASTVLMVSAAADASLAGHEAAVPSMYRDTSSGGPRPGARRPLQVPGVFALKLLGSATIGGHSVTREADVPDLLPLVALAPSPDLIVATDVPRLELTAGRQVTMTVSVDRRNGFTGRVPISLMNLPHGVRVDDVGLNGVMITEEETSRVVHIVAEPWVDARVQPILVVGRVEVNSPIRNEAAAMPVELVIKPAAETLTSVR